MVAAIARAPARERQRHGERIEDGNRREQPLRVFQLGQHLLPFLPGDESGQRTALPLHLMDAVGLGGRFIDGEREAAVL